MGSIKGKIRVIIYESDSNYKVGEIKVKETNDTEMEGFVGRNVHFTGYFANLQIGDNYEMEGTLVYKDKYGYQYNVTDYKRVEAKVRDAVIEFLTSDLVKGCGEATATLIVDTLGEDCLKKIKENPEILLTVPKMTQKKAEKIYSSLMKIANTDEMLINLKELGFSIQEALNIINKFGANAVSITKSNPYALKEIPRKTQITKDMIGHVKVPRSLVTNAKNIIQTDKDLINYYSSYSTDIPAKSLFYKEAVLKEEQMPDYAFMNMKDGNTVYSLKVNNKSTYSNRFRPGDYIDLYMEAKDNNKVMMAILVKSIKIKAIKDSSGNSILENTLSGGTPAALLFEVEDSLFDLLKKSEYVSNVEIIPVPRNSNYTKEEGSTTVSTEEITSYIYNKTETITN